MSEGNSQDGNLPQEGNLQSGDLPKEGEKKNETQGSAVGQTMSTDLKSWVMVVLTLLFVALYGAALMGWLKAAPDEKLLLHLQPIIAVIFGYYFGRLPGEQNENNLKAQVSQQTGQVETARNSEQEAIKAKAEHQTVLQRAEQKLDDVRATLQSVAPGGTVAESVRTLSASPSSADKESVRGAVAAALNILR